MARRDESEESQPKKQSFDFKKLLPKILKIFFLTADAMVMLGGAYMVYEMKIAYQRPLMTEQTESAALDKERENRDTRAVLLSLDPFVANLDGKPKKVLRTTIHLELLNEDGYEEAMDLGPVARDQIMRILNSKNLSEIETIQGKLFLKDQIMTAMNGLLHRSTVKEVYFGDFTIQ